MSQCFLPKELLDQYPDLPSDVKKFLSETKICKVEVSQVNNTWEIYFLCDVLPDISLIKKSCLVLKKIFPQIKKLDLKPKLDKLVSVQDFLNNNWSTFKSFLTDKYPSIRGWLINSSWQINSNNHLDILIGCPIGVKYLNKQGCNTYIEKWLTALLDTKVAVNFKYDCTIEKIAIKNQIQEENNIINKQPLKNSTVKSEKEHAGNIKKVNTTKPNNLSIYGKIIKGENKPITEIVEEEPNVVIEGSIFGLEVKELKTGRAILIFNITDLTDSITCKLIRDGKEIQQIAEKISNCQQLKVRGTVQIDKFSQELVLLVYDINQIEDFKSRQDTAAEKRVELHLHTKMSSMDGVSNAKTLIKLAADWGHQAIAITDHGIVQSFPEAYEAGKKYNVKIIYGMEGYIFDDEKKYSGKIPNYHCLMLVKNKTGLKNLYKLITDSHLKYFSRVPRIPKSLLNENREGLIIGTACEAGELIRNYLQNKGDKELLKQIAGFYDFIEIQPIGNNEFLIRNGYVQSEQDLINLNKDLFQLGKELNKPVIATGDVHFANPEDAVFRKILMAGKGFSDADQQGPLYFKTTDEMLEEFSYLGENEAKKAVIYNPKEIVNQVEDIKPIPDEFYPPEIPGAEDEIIRLTYETAHSWYGQELPEIVEARIKKELDSIINNGFAVLYLIAHKLVKKSNDDGYLVGSRGSVGSSFVATLTGITEVNPLQPHYRCPNCYYSQFITDGSYGSGADMPDKNCPQCNEILIKDGHDIPFEVFLGFKGDKVPDIDLNFSGEYQPRAHKYTEELFGKENVFRAGTISTIASRTAFGFVKNYLDERKKFRRSAEINRLVEGCSGVKKTTGQHPGGLMVVPKGIDVHDFTPLQRPADDIKSEIITTHFDYHSISSRLVKLDILGHDDPTVIKMLEDLTGIDARKIPLDHNETISLFSSTEALGINPEELGSNVGSYGIPEFGTKFVRQMLEDTKPQTFSELVRISGFSHGTDVWLNNAQDLIKSGIAKLSEAISARDDIMTYLIHKGLEPSRAFKIMEKVRKGKGVAPEDEEYMLANNVPTWYVESCKKIKYMFPKAHAVAYVMMAFRIAYFKLKYPLAFYATFFSVRADEFDADIICKGVTEIKNTIKLIQEKGNGASNKEARLLIILELALEMYLRGYNFQQVNLERSEAKKFIIDQDSLIPPFVGLQGVGITAAENIAKAREQRYFTSKEDLRVRAKVTKAVLETLENHGVLKGLPDSDQLALFS